VRVYSGGLQAMSILASINNDERDGYGEMVWTDGSKYIGEWKNGIQNGYGKMIFPSGVVKEGYFDNNIFKGPKKPDDDPQEEVEVKLEQSRPGTIEQESLWVRYGQTRKSRKKNKNLSESGKLSKTGYNNTGLPNINNTSYVDQDSYNYNALRMTENPNLKTGKKNTISQTQISFNRGRSQNRPRVSTATSSSLVYKRRNLQTTSTESRRKPPKAPKKATKAKRKL